MPGLAAARRLLPAIGRPFRAAPAPAGGGSGRPPVSGGPAAARRAV